MQLTNTAIPLFLVVLRLATIGRAAPPPDVIYHCVLHLALTSWTHPLVQRWWHRGLGKSFRRVSSCTIPETQGHFSDMYVPCQSFSVQNMKSTMQARLDIDAVAPFQWYWVERNYISPYFLYHFTNHWILAATTPLKPSVLDDRRRFQW